METTKQSGQRTDIFGYMASCSEHLLCRNREGTARIYQSAYLRFMEFTGRKKLAFNLITSHLLRDYEEFLRREHLSRNTISTYLNCLRSMFNRAVGEGLADGTAFPFRHLAIQPVRTNKPALRLSDIEELIRLKVQDDKVAFALSLFVFCFLACGIPFIDLAYLTVDNIRDGCLVYNRRKTHVRICVRLTRGMLAIIEKYKHLCVDGLLFPILKSRDASYTEYRSALKSYNRRLAKISALLPNYIKLTSYSARHAWAMEAKRQNAPVAVIGEALGHTSEKTTRFYLSSLDQSVLDKVNRRITASLEKLLLDKKRNVPYL